MAASPKVIDHVLAADDSLTVLALRYGSEAGAIMRENNLLSSDLDFLPLRVVSKVLKSASDGSVTEIEVVEREGTVLRIPVLYPTDAVAASVPSASDQVPFLQRQRESLAIAAVMKWAESRRTSLPRLSREEAAFYLSENNWDPPAAKMAIERDDGWEVDARRRDTAGGRTLRQR